MTLRHLWWRIAAMRDPHTAAATLDSILKPYFTPILQARNKGIFAIEFHNPKLGFFAKLNWCLFVLHYCQRRQLIPYLELTSANYLSPERGHDWFKYYFINQAMLNHGYDPNYRPRHVTRIRRISDLKLPAWCYHELTLVQASILFREAITLKPEIASEVDTYIKQNFAGKKILGIHFRGTDKIVEAPRVTWDYCERTVQNYLHEHPEIEALFIASDELRFIEHITSRFSDIPTIFRADHARSTEGRPVHKLDSVGDNYLKGKDAIVNSLLLSRCDALIRSSSFLSAWSSIFNPSLRVTLLNKPHDEALWFPEVEIMKQSLDKYLPENF